MKKYKEYPPSSKCSKCGGKCCRRMAGHYSPRDFEDLSYEGLYTEIKKGRISIDWWEGNKREFYLRARHIFEPIVFGSWGGICMNLTTDGCSLPREKRPLACRVLDPDRCHEPSEYSKEVCKNEWKEYEDILKRLVEVFE